MPLSLPQRLAIAREVTRTVLDGPAHRGPFTAGHQTLAAISAVCIGDVNEADTRKVLDAAMRRALGAAKLGLSEAKPDPIAVAMLMGECIGEVLCEREEARRLLDAVRHSGREEAATEEPPSEVHVGADPAEPGGERQVVTITGDGLTDEDVRALVDELGAETMEALHAAEHDAAPPAEAEPTMSHEEVGAILDLVAPVVEEAAAAPTPPADPPTTAPAPEPAPEPTASPSERPARPPRRAPK